MIAKPVHGEELYDFADEAPAQPETPTGPPWQILIVDDDRQVHDATVFALADVTVHERPLAFLHAYNGTEARRILGATRDVAVILLDVVMEEEHTGLRMVEVIREELGLAETRIILRTGQPGYAPELDAIRDYDINDYRTKSELTRTRLVTSLITAIRSFEQIRTISHGRRGLEKIVRAAADLFDRRALDSFADGVLIQIASLLGIGPTGIVCAQRSLPIAGSDPGDCHVISGAGPYAGIANRPLTELGDPRVCAAIGRCLETRTNQFDGSANTLHVSFDGHEAAIFVDTPAPLEPLDRQLLEVFAANVSVGFANVDLFGKLGYLAYHDPLTGLPNRRGFLRALEDAEPGDTTVCLFDIDRFSDINDALGSDLADAFLVGVATRLRANLPPPVRIARASGDTFALAGPSSHLSGDALLDLMREPVELHDDYPIVFSGTVGVVHLPEGLRDPKEALQQATLALNRAKDQARGEYVAYTEQMSRESRRKLDMLQALRAAMRGNAMALHYQPQVEVHTGRVVGAEALLRWRREDGGYVPPGEFIPLAERSGLIVELGAWVIGEACRQLRAWRAAGLGDLRLAINVSMPQFRAGSFVASLTEAIAANALPPSSLEVEITEGMVMEDVESTIGTLRVLKDIGVSIAIDDFGTGFSSLAYLQRLPVDVMKVDRAFVSGIGGGGSAERIAEMIVALGRTLSLQTVAEGVETADQLDIVRRWGCQIVQGYYHAPPMAPEAFEAWVRRRRTGGPGA
ncbi:MAG TPA: EAL domain-containing protein [Rhodocyclaceae bacterium]|nr:EAL domain-containing protein [Rhodocyclaceae bacterium]